MMSFERTEMAIASPSPQHHAPQQNHAPQAQLQPPNPLPPWFHSHANTIHFKIQNSKGFRGRLAIAF
ncbi:hypothetical protein NC969_08145 [Leptolyngbya subtilissima ST-M1]|uniref:hypothetical protein n=2 Tax=Cyanophyceae TaxID=3028117 RepID=UPI001A7E3ED8|nr:hypothetical protein [Nodosilinea sp. FACHB-131]